MTEETTSTAPSMGVFGRIINIFSAPKETMESINEKPTWLVPYLIVTIVTVVLTFALMDIRQQDTIAMFEAQDKPAEMIEGVQNMPAAMRYGQLIPIPIVMIAIWAVFGGVLLFAGNTILGGESKFKKVFSMVAWSGLVGVCGFIVQSLLVMMKGTSHGVTTSLAILLPTPAIGQSPSLLYRILTQFDVFALWQMWIWVIGVSVLFRFTKQKSATMVFSIWGLWVILSVALGSLFGNSFGT